MEPDLMREAGLLMAVATDHQGHGGAFDMDLAGAASGRAPPEIGIRRQSSPRDQPVIALKGLIRCVAANRFG